MKLLTTFSPEIKEANVDGFIVGLKSMSSHCPYYFNEEELTHFIQTSHKEIYLLVNQFLFQESVDKVISDIITYGQKGLTGVILSDYGLLAPLKEACPNMIYIVSTDTTLTSTNDCQVLLEAGFDYVIFARELIDQEYESLIKQFKHQCGLYIFTHQIMSTSKRYLLDAYGEEVGIHYESDRIYQLKEKTRDEPYMILQDHTGTHIFDGKIYSVISHLKQLNSLGLEIGIIDSTHIDSEILLEVINRIKNEQFDLSDLPLQLTDGLFHTKTSDKKVDQWKTK